MSVIALKQEDRTQISTDVLCDIASKNGFKIREEDEEDYKTLLSAADTVIQHVNDLPEYRDPRLEPDLRTITERKFWKAKNNVLNAWSNQSNFHARSNDTTTRLLYGRTICFKDNISVGGLPLTCGTFPQLLSKDGEYPISNIDAPIVTRVLQSSGTIKGTATCENYSMCALSYSSASGPVHNPWMRGYTTGGSSSGCAALVALARVKEWKSLRGLSVDDLGEGCDLGIGADQGGSIRLPAAYTGVYGLKPTHGLIPYTGIASLHPLIDHCGVITNSVYDIAVMLSVLAGYDGIDPRMSPETPLRENVKDYRSILADYVDEKQSNGEWTSLLAAKGLRVGIIKEAWEVAGLDPEVAMVVRSAAHRFEKEGALVEEISIPLHREGPAIWTAATRAAMADFATKNQPLPLLSYPLPNLSPSRPTQEFYDLLSRHNPAVINVILNSTYIASRYSPSVVAKAIMHANQLRAAYDAKLEEYDILITPTNPTAGMRHPREEDGVIDKISKAVGNTLNTCPFNASGHPALSMPVGWAKVPDGDERLPVGMQIISKRWNEEVILRAALAWEVGGLGLDNDQ